MSIFLRALFVAVFVAWCLPASATEMAAQSPTPRVGDTWKWENTATGMTGEDTVTAVDSTTVTVSSRYANGNVGGYTLDRNLNLTELRRAAWVLTYGTMHPYPLVSFPLYVGKTWEDSFVSAKGRNYTVTHAVVAYETITAPFGAVMVYRIKAEHVAADPGANGAEEVLYAPELGYVVAHRATSGWKEDWRMTSFTHGH